MTEKTVFISYRRSPTGNAFARSVQQALMTQGYDAFIDVDHLGPGSWEDQLRIEVSKRAHFLLLLTPGALDRCSDPKDLVRQEFELAMQAGRNIVGVREESVDLTSLRKSCPAVMQPIFGHQIVELRHTGFARDCAKLIHDFIPPHKAPPQPPHVPATSVLIPDPVNLILNVLVILATIFTLLQGIKDDWRPAPLIPFTIALNGCWLIQSLPSDIKLIAFAALIALVCGFTILIGHLMAKKDLQAAWGISGCTLLIFGIGAATAAVIRRRGGASGRAGD